MERVIKFKTRDGKLHDTFLAAERYVEEQYGNLLTALASKTVRVEKYTAMVCFLEENLDKFLELSELRRDKILPPPDED